MQILLTWSVCVVVLAGTVSAHSAPSSLKGDYAVTGSSACLAAPGSSAAAPTIGNTTPNADAGFTSELRPINPSKSFSTSNNVEGIRTFNGDGTGTVNIIEVGFAAPPTPDGTLFPHFPPSAESARNSIFVHLHV